MYEKPPVKPVLVEDGKPAEGGVKEKTDKVEYLESRIDDLEKTVMDLLKRLEKVEYDLDTAHDQINDLNSMQKYYGRG